MEHARDAWLQTVTSKAKGGQDDLGSSRNERLLEVAEWLDAEAVRFVAAKGVLSNQRQARLWRSHLPFGLTSIGSALRHTQPLVAVRAFRKCHELARELPQPAREWALCWNTLAWAESGDPEGVLSARAMATQLADLKDHEPWDAWLPLLVEQTSRFDPEAALRIARSAAEPLRPEVLVAVAKGMRTQQ